MRHAIWASAALLLVAGCATDSGSGVVDEVLADFGLKDRPEGYVSGADQVFQNLADVGKSELKRLNQSGRHGEIKFEADGLRGLYYKVSKVYEDYHPLDAQPISRTTNRDRGYNGYIEYTWRMYQSSRKPTSAEAQAEVASIPTDENGRDVLRYRFGATGVWDGEQGAMSRER